MLTSSFFIKEDKLLLFDWAWFDDFASHLIQASVDLYTTESIVVRNVLMGMDSLWVKINNFLKDKIRPMLLVTKIVLKIFICVSFSWKLYTKHDKYIFSFWCLNVKK